MTNFIATKGDDTFTGSAGQTDTVDYSGADAATGGVNVTLGIDTVQVTNGSGTDTFTSIDAIIGTAFGDSGWIRGSGNFSLSLGGGDDHVLTDASGGTWLLDGGTGNDTWSGNLVTGATPANLVHDGLTGAGTVGGITLSGIEVIEVSLSQGNDTISLTNANTAWIQSIGGADTFTIKGLKGESRLDAGDVWDAPNTEIDRITLNLTDEAYLYGLSAYHDEGHDNYTVGASVNGGRLSATAFEDVTVLLNGEDNEFTVLGLSNGAGRSLHLDGGAGTDTLHMQIYMGNGNLSLTAVNGTTTGSLGVYDNFENFDLRLGDGNSTISLAAGNDTVTGYSGNDTVNGGDGNDVITAQLGQVTAHGGNGNDQLTGSTRFDQLFGDAGDDYIQFNGANSDGTTDIVDGGAGDDIIAGSGEGGDGIDRIIVAYAYTVDTPTIAIDFSTADDSASFNLPGGGTASHFEVATVYIGDWQGASFEDAGWSDQVFGGSGFDTINGHDGSDALFGGSGLDRLDGGTGNDWLFTGSNYGPNADGSHYDEAFGGAGDDHIGDIVGYVDWLAAGSEPGQTITNNPDIRDLFNLAFISGNDRLFGGDGNDLILGWSGDDVLSGEAGMDTLYGGWGNDIYNVGDSDVVIEAAGEGIDQVVAQGNYSLGANFENLFITGTANPALLVTGTGNALNNTILSLVAGVLNGEGGDDILQGQFGAFTLNGGDGNDRLSSDVGSDTFYGGAGNDTFVTDGRDTIIETAGQGIDTVEAAVSYALGQFVENLILTDTAVRGVGNTSANTLTGNELGNVLDGGLGADTLTGGGGNDSYVVDNVGDVVTELADSGTDTVASSVRYTLGANLERLVLTGTAGIAGTGNGLANIITGNAGNNRLDGGAGADTLIGGAGDDVYSFDNAGDSAFEKAGEGNDSITTGFSYALGTQYIENLTLTGAGNINATGNALRNTLVGSAGNNVLNGGTGADNMWGGAGNDSYYVDNIADRTYEKTLASTDAGGHDVVYASVRVTLDQFVEDLIITGTANLAGSGNGLDNRITGNSGNNILFGKDGNDSLDGGAGNDVLAGGLGADVFLFGLASGADIVSDYDAAQGDSIDLHAWAHGVVNGGGIVITQAGAHTIITLGGGNSVTVLHTSAADVSAHIVW